METINYERIPHIIERQYAAEQAFLAEFEAGNYTLTNPLVKLNPYEFCPLTAVVMFETPAASEATITVLGKEVEGNITHRFPSTKTSSKSHLFPQTLNIQQCCRRYTGLKLLSPLPPGSPL